MNKIEKVLEEMNDLVSKAGSPEEEQKIIERFESRIDNAEKQFENDLEKQIQAEHDEIEKDFQQSMKELTDQEEEVNKLVDRDDDDKVPEKDKFSEMKDVIMNQSVIGATKKLKASDVKELAESMNIMERTEAIRVARIKEELLMK